MSQRIQLDFIENKPFSPTQITGFGLGMLLLGIVLAMMMWRQYHQQQDTYLAILQEQTAKTMPIKPTIEIKPVNTSAALVISPVQLATMRETQSLLNLPWQPLLQALANANSVDIALLTMEPSIKKRQLALKGEVRNMPALLHYIEQLEAQTILSQVVLQTHSVNDTNPYKAIRFSIIANWRVDKLTEGAP